MGISLKPEYLKRYKDVSWLLIKYGNSDLVKNAGLEEVATPDDKLSTEAPAKAEELSHDLEKLGPAFVKLGQLLSTRPDFVPAAYLESLSRLQDNCEPFPFADVEKIVVEELGVRLSKAFSEFCNEPLAAASLGQIHQATMRDGRKVAVKIQRPCIRESIIQDLDILASMAEFYDNHTESGKRYEFGLMLEEFRKSIIAELDYRKEARNLEALRTNLREFDRIVVPAPIMDYSTSKVLTMEFISGKKITAVTQFELLELDGAGLAEEVFRAYLKQILIDGNFHADPHPGNVLLTNDNKIALLDLGMTAHLTLGMQGKLLQMLMAISEGRADTVCDIAESIGTAKTDYDETAWRKRITDLVQQADANIEDMQIGKVVLGITKSSGECGMRVPAELTMLGKTLLNLDQVGRTLDPQFDPNASVRKNAAHIMEQRLLKNASPGHIFNALLEGINFADNMPARINKILDMLAGNKLKMKVDTIDEKLIIDAVQKVANRITLGLVLAALIIGASLLMRVPSRFTILGYPGLAMICFVCAACGGFALAVQIAFYDQRPQKLSSK